MTARRAIYAVLHLEDTERNIGHARVLGEWHEVYSRDILVGSDPGCDVIIEHPAVPPRAVAFFARGHHQYAKRLPDGPDDRSKRPVAVGPFRVAMHHTSTPHELPPRIDDPRLGFSARCQMAQRPIAELPVDPRAAEIARLRRCLADGANHLRVLDAAAMQWCEEQVRMHFAALSRVSAPLPPLALRRVEYASPRTAAIARWWRAWDAVRARPFDPAAWAHVHRFDRWRGQLREARRDEYHDADSFTSGLWFGLERAHGQGDPMIIPVTAIATCHLATLDDDASPARPLSALIARGVYPFALPGNAMLLVLTGCDDPLSRSSDPGADRELAAGDDAAMGIAPGPALVAQPAAMFPEAHAIAMYRKEDDPDSPRADAAPAMQLERAGRRYRLRAASAIDDKLALVPLTDGVDGVHLVHAGGAVLVSRHGGVQLAINGRSILLPTPRALFDGDELVLTAPGRKLVVTVRAPR